MKGKLTLLAVVLFFITSLLIFAGGQSSVGTEMQDTLIWANDREMDIVLPYYDESRTVIVTSLLTHDTLLYRDPDTFEYKPLLATSYKWIDDQTMEFELRKDVVFHDGTKFSADDVAATFNHVTSDESGVVTKRNVEWIGSCEKIDDYKVRLNLKTVFPAALEYLSGPLAIFPSEIWGTAETVAGKKDYRTVEPIGTGPYKMTEMIPGEVVKFTRNEDYFGGIKGKGKIRNIVMKTIPDREVQVAELLAGNIHWIWNFPIDRAEELSSVEGIEVASASTMRIDFLVFDAAGRSKHPAIPDIRVRRAIAHAVDRQAIATHLMGPGSVVPGSFCYPPQFGCTQSVQQYEYDPEKSKKLLAEAGYPNGFEMDLFAYDRRHTAEAVVNDLREIGIKANLRYMQNRAMQEFYHAGECPVTVWSWGSYSINDISAITSNFSGPNAGTWDYAQDPDVHRWLEAGDTSVDPEVRKANYAKALERIAEEVYILPLYSVPKYHAFADNVDFTPDQDEIARFFKVGWK